MDANPPTAADLAWAAADDARRAARKHQDDADALRKRVARLERVLGLYLSGMTGRAFIHVDSPEVREITSFIDDANAF